MLRERVRPLMFVALMAASTACIGGRGESLPDMSSAFVADPFEADDGTKLDAHAAGPQWKWIKHTVRNVDTALITDGRAHHDGGKADAIYFVSTDPPSRDYDVTADIYVASNVPMLFTGICGRMQIDAKTMYVVWYSHSNTRWQLARFEGGSLTGIGEYIHTPEARRVYRVTLQLRDGAQAVLIDGIRRISTHDKAITGPGRPGLYFTAQDPLGDGASDAGHQVEAFWASAR